MIINVNLVFLRYCERSILFQSDSLNVICNLNKHLDFVIKSNDEYLMVTESNALIDCVFSQFLLTTNLVKLFECRSSEYSRYWVVHYICKVYSILGIRYLAQK